MRWSSLKISRNLGRDRSFVGDLSYKPASGVVDDVTPRSVDTFRDKHQGNHSVAELYIVQSHIFPMLNL